MKEHDIQNAILETLQYSSGEFFRVNVLAGFMGRYKRNFDGSVTVFNPSYIKSGVPKGFPDIIGIKPRLISEFDVGKVLGQFAFLEVKNERGRLSPEQVEMCKLLKYKGALGGTVRSVDDALKILYQ